MEKVTRNAFLYFNPHQQYDPEHFAQCKTCRVFVPSGAGQPKDLCVFHGSKFPVEVTGSCGCYVIWPKSKPNPQVIEDHRRELASNLPGSVTPEESGYVDRKVRCENCAFFSGVCDLYRDLTKAFPAVFDLDHKVEEYGCCNANTERGGKPYAGLSGAEAVDRIPKYKSGVS